MQGVSLLRTGRATPRAAQIEAGRLRLFLDPSALCFELRDAQSPFALSAIAPRVDAMGPGGEPLPLGPARTLSIGELKGRGGAALRLELQTLGRGFLGARWTLEVPAAGDGLACTLALENRTGQKVVIRCFAPLARGTAAMAPARLPAELPVHLLRSDRALLALGFTTERRHRARVRVEGDSKPEPAFSLENALDPGVLMPGESVESERAWLALGADEASLLAEWARLAGVEMEARAPGRAVVVSDAPQHELPLRVRELERLGDLVVVEPEEDPVSGRSDPLKLREFACEAKTWGALPGLTLAAGPGKSRATLAAECGALRALGIEHVTGRLEETTLGSVGLIDTLRLPAAPGPEGVRRALDLSFSGQRLWRLEAGPTLSPSGLAPSEADKTRLCVFALAGAALRVAGDPRELDPERARWLRLATPGLARPAVAVPIPGGRALLVSLVGDRRAVLLVNESEATRSLGVEFHRLGIAGPHHVFEFWQEQVLGESEEAVAPAPVPAFGSRLLALTPVAPRAQVIGTNLHLGMGCVEAGGIRVQDDGALGLTLRLPGARKGAVWIALPAEATARRIEVSFEDTLSLRLRFPPHPA